MDLMVGIDFQPQLNQNIPLSYLCENITIDNYSHMSNKINVWKSKSALHIEYS